MKITSAKYSLDLYDVGKGLLVAGGSAVLTEIQQSLAAGSLTFNWKIIGSVALAAMVSYLAKNFFTPSQQITPGASK